MIKDFDSWNVIKKKIDSKNLRRYYHEREIWWCSMGVNVGHEQDGKGNNRERPILILRAISRKACIVAPLTTSPKKHSYRIPIIFRSDKVISVIISQLRLIDTKRLNNRLGILNRDEFEKIRKSVRSLF